jgi:hypothetical protein
MRGPTDTGISGNRSLGRDTSISLFLKDAWEVNLSPLGGGRSAASLLPARDIASSTSFCQEVRAHTLVVCEVHCLGTRCHLLLTN